MPPPYGIEPEDSAQKLSAAGAHDPREAQHFTTPQLEARVVRHTHAGKLTGGYDDLARGAGRVRVSGHDVAPGHHANDGVGRRRRRVARPHGRTVAKHRETMRNAAHL